MQNIFGKLKELGYKTCPEDFYGNIATWKSWYMGDVADFHHYKVWNGQKHIQCRRFTLGMAKKVCEDWANLLMNEKVALTLEGESEQAFFDQTCEENNFRVKANELEELTFFGGTSAIVVSAENVPVNERTGQIVGTGGRLRFDYVHMPNIYPLSWANGRVRDCAFATEKVNGNDKYLYLTVHHVGESGTYVIENYLFRDNNGSLTEVELSELEELQNVAKRIETGSTDRQFVINRPNIVNNLNPTLPLGVSIFANAVDQLKGVDIVYDAYVNEFVLGKKRIMVKTEALKSIDGEYAFDPNDVVFHALPEDSSAGAEANIIHEIDMSLRTPQLNEGIQDMLNNLSSKVGFGENHYKYDRGSISTATQIISENSTLFRTIKKHELVLESVLTELARIILRMGNTYCGQALNEEVEISVDFDDSIITDKQADFQRDMAMLSAGILNPWEFRATWMNEDESTAKAALPKMEELVSSEKT